MRTYLKKEQYLEQVEGVGFTIVAPPEDSCAVEKKIYGIRDVSDASNVYNKWLVFSKL